MNCQLCGKPMKLRQGKKGAFYGCTGYPQCTFTAQADENSPESFGKAPSADAQKYKVMLVAYAKDLVVAELAAGQIKDAANVMPRVNEYYKDLCNIYQDNYYNL